MGPRLQGGDRRLFVRALLAFLAMPGIVAFAVPLAWAVATSRLLDIEPAGLLLLLAGLAGLLGCVRQFYVSGKGTLAPWAPPEHLVVDGLYRYSRNPMYVAVVVVLLGWAATYHSLTLLLYAVGVAVAFHLRVVYGEEPFLARTHGEAWEEYASRVPRWFG